MPQFGRRTLTRRQAIAGMAGSAALPLAAANSGKLDREAIVKRHNPVLRAAVIDSALQVGNGEFALSADITGLQTFPAAYEEGMPLGTMAQWAWHAFPNPENFQLREVMRPYEAYGRTVLYAETPNEPERARRAVTWLRENPERIHLARIGLQFAVRDGRPVAMADLSDVRQELDLWRGLLSSEFRLGDSLVRVETVCHPRRDLLAVRICSPLLQHRKLGVAIAFPYASTSWTKGYDWDSPARYQTKVARSDRGATFDCILDETRYTATAAWPAGARLQDAGPHHFHLFSEGQEEIELAIEFSPTRITGRIPRFAEVRDSSARHWSAFWISGGAIDFSESTDPRAAELERRVVLSQYLMAVNCAGSMPPQETGLATNSWWGKSHLEMHWWHAAHFVLWGRPELLERSLPWYRSILPRAKDTAKLQGYRGARWPKQVGPDGRESPSDVGVFLIWQQPHPIYYAELLYRSRPDRGTLEAYREIVFETAEFMASYAVWDSSTRRYVLGPPLIPAQESYSKIRRQVTNPTYELAYWHWGLSTAQRWRERLGMPRHAEWDRVIQGLARPLIRNGTYTAIEAEPFTVYNDHPSMLCALGVLPATPLIDASTMRSTLDDVLVRWNWNTTWGWDYPVMAMTAARLGEPEKAVDALLMDSPKNQYLAGGQNLGTKGRLPLYLPGNGGLLYAVAMMAAGWDGAPASAPGFAISRGWKIKWEGLQRAL
ncbi:MAG TPA: glycoside hydrolase family 65 [Bryobacteraceae bacterium]|jgi:hypothetical protein